MIRLLSIVFLAGGPGAAGAQDLDAAAVQVLAGPCASCHGPDGRSPGAIPSIAGLPEATAAELQLPIHIEGYAPPNDPRLNVIRVAPDPGVIEVNIHPASSWRDCVAITEAIYEEARLSRLTTEKFLIDGRAVGTGGGFLAEGL